MKNARFSLKTLAMGGCALGVLAMASQAAAAEFAVEAQELRPALQAFAAQGDQQVLFSSAAVAGKRTAGFRGDAPPEVALQQLLSGTDLVWSKTEDGALLVMTKAEARNAPQSQGAAGGGAEVEALIVTAQKREEDIQDVPIAISAFTQEDLTRSQVAGGPDLMTQVPNMTFTKTNFTSYSIQIRGIGTQAVSATTDAAVAVAFNNTPFIRNRFFEQEFYDLQRVEVLRGPQGTLYGRNATAGVVNIISAKPKFGYEAKVSADVANYSSTRLEGMINIPLAEDIVAFRLAGAWTQRDGFVTNENTGEQTDGRDLWSTRASLRIAPNDRLDVNLIWEHFEEDDDRLRSGKQLCHTDEVTEVAGFPTTHYQTLPLSGQSGEILFGGVQGTFSQGCRAASLYSPDSFQVPSGLSLPYYGPLVFLQLPVALDDPYESRSQSHDLRVIQSTVEPIYQAKNDLIELQVSFDLTDALTLASETAYAVDEVFSMQDFNRFNTAPGAWSTTSEQGQAALAAGLLDENGVFCDPQVGCSDRLAAVDVSTAKSSHFSQEFRLSSNYEGAFNFSLGANFLRYDTEEKYYVFINSLTMLSARAPWIPGVSDNRACLKNGAQPGKYQGYPFTGCLYIDPNPIGALNDQGHNYFLSKNPYKLISYAVFGEAYYNLAEDLKITAGLRWTVDKKEAPRVPSWLLAPESYGYPVIEVVEQEWTEPTGRLTIDWKPNLSFTDETLIYASAARGYKAGGSNPPPYVPVFYAAGTFEAAEARLVQSSAKPATFDPEFINAFEVGAKNTFLDGALTVNLAAFYYDYEGYQISQIVDRSAANLNFDSTVWGLEIEADWRPLENLRLGFKGGYENTRVADGEKAIDIMDRTAGRTDWVTVSPFPTFASNCILPAWLFVGYGDFDTDPDVGPRHQLVNVGSITGGGNGGCELAYVLGLDPVTGLPYVPDPEDSDLYNLDDTRLNYPGWNPLDASQGHNNGEGFFKDLSGNELPNAPNFTATITADYTLPLSSEWLMTLHTDLYYQSEAWTRIFNMEGYDKLKAYTNVNLAAIFANEDAGWRIMAYVKNVFDRDSITGAFLNSDDTGLTTNVFLTEPRLYGLRVSKEWGGGPWWTGANPDHAGPYPFTVELGGQVQRHDAPNAPLSADFLGQFSSALNPENVQNRKMDWGDGRQVRLTYHRFDAPWFLSVGARTGETNTGTMRERLEEAAGGPECALSEYFFERYEQLSGRPFDASCDPEHEFYMPFLINRAVNWSDAEVRRREEHVLADFMVGRDVGVGGLSNSSVSFGLRYARLKSTTSAFMDGIPNWELPENWALAVKYSTHNRYTSKHDAEREFDGFGPAASWEASLPFLGGDDTGRVQLDWAVGGGLLFGKQKTSITGYERSADFSGTYGAGLFSAFDPTLDNIVTTPLDIPTRSESVTVPVVDLSLGLSYEIQRIKVGAGYRWERFFDAIDGGFEEASQQDRTIDGPYFKLSVGFGG